MFHIRKTLIGAAAAAAATLAAWQVSAATDMVITSEIAASHWKARQMDELAKEITERSQGRINAQVFHASTLYKDKDALEALSTGAVNMVWPVSFWLENINPAYAIVNLPFSLTDEMMLNTEYRQELAELMSSLVEDKGLKVLGLARTSEAVFLSKAPIQSVDDLKGKKIRVPSGKVLHQIMDLYGAAPVTMATTEIATALAQGAVDMVYTSPGGWQMVGTQASHANVVPSMQISTYSVVVDRNWLDSLDPEDREIILSATADAMAKQWQPAMDADKAALDDMAGKGGTVVVLSPEQVAEFKARAEPAIAGFLAEHPEIAERFEALRARYAN